MFKWTMFQLKIWPHSPVKYDSSLNNWRAYNLTIIYRKIIYISVTVIIHSETTMFWEQQARFGNKYSIRKAIQDRLTRVGELSNQVNHPRNSLMICNFLHVVPFRVLRNHVNKLLILDTRKVVHSFFTSTVIALIVTIVFIVHILYTIYLLTLPRNGPDSTQ